VEFKRAARVEHFNQAAHVDSVALENLIGGPAPAATLQDHP
jgi:hypothetical protein